MYVVRKSTYRKLMQKYEQATRDLSRLYEENDRLREQMEEWRKEIAIHKRQSNKIPTEKLANSLIVEVSGSKRGNQRESRTS